MGTQIQSKRYSTGYCSIWGLHENAENDIWSLYREDKPQKNGQYCESFLPWHLKLDGSIEYDKEKVRQTILKHESTFRHQLQELHRLYGRQRELMNVLRRRDVKQEASNSSPFTSHISSEDAKRTWHVSHAPSLPLVFGQSSVSEFRGKQSFLGFSKEKNMMAFPPRDDGNSKISEPPSSKRTLLQKRIIDLEIPADAYMNNEPTYSAEICCGLPMVESNSITSTQEILHGRGVKTLFCNALNDHHNGDASRSSLPLKRKNKLADLNEPILLEESSVSGSADNPGDLSGSWGHMQSEDVSATPNSVLNPLWKDASISSEKEMDSETCFKSLQSTKELRRKEQLTCDFKAKQMQRDSHSIVRDVCFRDPCAAFQSSQAEHRKMNEISTSERGRTERKIKRKLFGVDIFEVNDETLVTETNAVHCGNKIDEHGSKHPFLHVKFSVDSHTRSFPSSTDGLNAMRSQGNSVVSYNFTNCRTTFECMPKESAPIDRVKSVEHLDWNSADVSETAAKASNFFQDDSAGEHNVPSADCQSKGKSLKGSSLNLVENIHCAEQTRENKNYYHLNLDSLQNSSQQFFKKTTSLSSEKLSQKLEKISPGLIRDTDDRNLEVHVCRSAKMYRDFPISSKQSISKDLNFSGICPEPTCLADEGDNAGNASLEKVASGNHSAGKVLNLEEPVNNPFSCLPGHIDLNLSLVEDEAPSAPCLPAAIVKLAKSEVDLEVPMVLESEADEQFQASSNGSKEPCEEVIRLAAEAIVAISVFGGEDILNDVPCGAVEDTPNDCLKWFVDVVASYECLDQTNMNDVNLRGDGGFTEELTPDGMDYFEYMTLKLEDIKSNGCFHNYSAPVMENQDDEETKVPTLSRRPRRGQARRGRQRKDFQRDILPSLISLSKLEVTEDFQTFEEVVRASGSTWQSSFSRRSTAKSSRGRRRSVAMPPTQEAETVCSPLEQKPVSRELQLEDKSLTGWGKRTRRLPRQRYITGTATPL